MCGCDRECKNIGIIGPSDQVISDKSLIFLAHSTRSYIWVLWIVLKSEFQNSDWWTHRISPTEGLRPASFFSWLDMDTKGLLRWSASLQRLWACRGMWIYGLFYNSKCLFRTTFFRNDFWKNRERHLVTSETTENQSWYISWLRDRTIKFQTSSSPPICPATFHCSKIQIFRTNRNPLRNWTELAIDPRHHMGSKDHFDTEFLHEGNDSKVLPDRSKSALFYNSRFSEQCIQWPLEPPNLHLSGQFFFSDVLG